MKTITFVFDREKDLNTNGDVFHKGSFNLDASDIKLKDVLQEFMIINGKGEDNIEGEVNATDSEPTYHVPDDLKADTN